MIKIAVDMMGSDLGPSILVEAIKQYIEKEKDVAFTLFGDKETLSQLIKEGERVSIIDAKDVIPMEIKPIDFLRKKESSMYKAIASVKNKECDGVLSAGSTGGFISGATFLLRNIEGVSRAGLCACFPTYKRDKGAVILDVGANNNNTAEDLYGYARMGRLYAKYILNVENPSVYTLSNGVEEGKGRDEVVEAYKLLQERKFPNFKGNSEAREVLDGEHDVIVTAGFSGNILLKATEGVASMMNRLIKDSFSYSFLTKIGYLFARRGFKDMKVRMNYKKYGGAILLGVNGVACKAHGNSDAYAFYNAIDITKKMIVSRIVDKIRSDDDKGA